jgi:hypothetical protein
MTSKEHAEYNRLTEEMEADFLILTATFMGYCEDIIFGEEIPEIKYYCFHFYNDNYSKSIFQRLSYRIERLLKRMPKDFRAWQINGFSNLLIYLKEPITKELDEKYKAENYLYWRNVVIADPELAHNSSFRKYLLAL